MTRNNGIKCFQSRQLWKWADMTDYRLMWMRDRITKLLGVQDHPEALEELLKEHQDAFQAYLNNEINDVSEMEKCVFFIFRTFYDRLVEREVVTIEKGKLNSGIRLHLLCWRWPNKMAFLNLVPLYRSQFHELWRRLHHRLIRTLHRRRARKEKVGKGSLDISLAQIVNEKVRESFTLKPWMLPALSVPTSSVERHNQWARNTSFGVAPSSALIIAQTIIVEWMPVEPKAPRSHSKVSRLYSADSTLFLLHAAACRKLWPEINFYCFVYRLFAKRNV